MRNKTRVDENGRVCTKCGKYKLWEEFHKGKGANGYTPQCKQCVKEKDAQRHKEKQKIKDLEKQRLWEAEEVELDKKYPNRISREEAKEQGLLHYFTGRPCKNGHIDKRLVSTKDCCGCARINTAKNYNSEKAAEWYQKNRERVLLQQKKWAKNNPDKVREKQYRWNKANPERRKEIERRSEEKRREQRRIERNLRRKEDLAYLLKERYRDRILKAVKNNRTEKAFKTAELLGCTVPEFIEYLKGTMTENMTWNDFMTGDLHLDHKKPLASFLDLSQPEQQLEAFNYTNYQLLWKEDNLSKGAKYNGIDYRLHKGDGV